MGKMQDRRITGRLRKPGRPGAQVSDFSTSFTEKMKANNDTLAKSLANARLLIEQQADEVKKHKSNYSEMLIQKSSDQERMKEFTARMEGCIRKCLNQVNEVIGCLIEMTKELNTSKASENSYRSFHTEPSSQKVISVAQTQSVGPMVKGHSILQPRISLLRINSHMENGDRVPALPVPAVPASADASASPSRKRKAVAVAVQAKEQIPSPDNAPVGNHLGETMDLFLARVYGEDPMEGSSRGITQRLFEPLETVYTQSSDDEDDNDDKVSPITPSNRTLYSPKDMDLTISSRRLSTILEPVQSPLLVAQSSLPQFHQNNKHMTDEANAKQHIFSDVENLSPIANAFPDFNESMGDARVRSFKELQSPLRNASTLETINGSEGNGKANVVSAFQATPVLPTGIESEPVNPPATPKNPFVRLLLSEKRIVSKKHSAEQSYPKSSACRSDFYQHEKSKSVPSSQAKRLGTRCDPDWRPKSEASRGSVRERPTPMKKRQIFPSGQCLSKEFENMMFFGGGNSEKKLPVCASPRVVIDRLDPALVDAATRLSSSSSGVCATEREVSQSGRLLRNVGTTSYKEPYLNVKMRRS